jgi:hypothetical protein
LELAKKTKRTPDRRMVRSHVIDSFPAPVGEPLRKVLCGTSIDVERLRNLVLTYEAIGELLCFAAVSQLWNAKHETPTLALTADQVAALENLLTLDEARQSTYDYLAVLAQVVAVFRANAVTPFVEELAGVEDLLRADDFDRARRFMEEMRGEMAGGPITADEITSFCVQAETHLATVLAALAFVVRYRLATIKKIDIIKPRHRPPTYRHLQILLDKVLQGSMETPEDYDSFTDSRAVIMLKPSDGVKQYLSLSPFVIDENALTGNENSKLFLYSHRAGAGAFAYRFIMNEDDQLVVSAERYDEVKTQFDELAQAVRPQ